MRRNLGGRKLNRVQYTWVQPEAAMNGGWESIELN
jgi:hypothetical protein